MTPKRGEVWVFDCGMAEKVRPVLVLSVLFGEAHRAVVTVVFHSAALRGSGFEVKVDVPLASELRPNYFLTDDARVTRIVATAMRRASDSKGCKSERLGSKANSRQRAPHWVTVTGPKSG